jgi:hypothetical protein
VRFECRSGCCAEESNPCSERDRTQAVQQVVLALLADLSRLCAQINIGICDRTRQEIAET